MTHPDVEAQVDALLDGELAERDAAEVEAHLAACPACARFREDRLALRSAVRAELPRLDAPDVLRARVRAALRKEAGHQRGLLGRAGRWLALAASLAAVAIGSWQLGSMHGATSVLADEVIASHVRSASGSRGVRVSSGTGVSSKATPARNVHASLYSQAAPSA